MLLRSETLGLNIRFLGIGMAISKRLILDLDRTMKTGYSISQWFNCITLKKLYILMQFHYNFQDVDIWLS